MKIALISGSPKNISASNFILKELRILLEKDSNIITEYHFRKSHIDRNDMEKIIECDVLVFVFPLYVDAIPSHLISCLIELEDFIASYKEKKIKVYSIVNCGFYEGVQNKVAIEIMENWCIKAGLQWGQGVGIGAGGMISMLQGVPSGYGPRKNMDKALMKLANNILENGTEENIFITANFPRIAYKLAAERGFRQAIKANGLNTKDLYMRR